MAYVSVDVDVDLDEIDTEDLVREVADRLTSSSRKNLTDIQKKLLRAAVKELNAVLNNSVEGEVNCVTIEDQMKMEIIKTAFTKYTSWQLEERLK
jgi:hypothetical protein